MQRESYGHALVVDPWGEVVARCSEAGEEGIAVAEIDRDWLLSVRARMPVAQHRRYDVYESATAPPAQQPAAEGAASS